LASAASLVDNHDFALMLALAGQQALVRCMLGKHLKARLSAFLLVIEAPKLPLS
jgi:hypothetical protein